MGKGEKEFSPASISKNSKILKHFSICQGDYFRLGHGSDQHLRKPTPIQGLRGKKVVHVAVGALHCLAVTDTGEVIMSNIIIRLVILTFV